MLFAPVAKQRIKECRVLQYLNPNLSIPNAWFLSQWNALPDTAVHCGIEMSTCTLTVHFAVLQNLLKLLIIGRFW